MGSAARVKVLGFIVLGVGCRVVVGGLGFGVWGLAVRVEVSGFMIYCLGLRVKGLGFVV